MKTIIILIFSFHTIVAYHPFTCFNTTSCSPRLGPEYSLDACQWKKYGNHSNNLCNDRIITPYENGPDLGDVQLKAYVSMDRRTLFNVTFSSIKWTDLTMRYRINDLKNTSFCMDFHIKEDTNILPGRSFYYDCPWATDYVGKEGTFEYEYSNGNQVASRKFAYIVPAHEKLEKAETLFLYVDITSLNNLMLFIQLPEVKYNLTQLEIYVNRQRNDLLDTVDFARLTYEDLQSYLDVGFIEFPYKTWMEPGTYYFAVIAHIDSSKTLVTSKKITIPKSTNKVYIGIVGISVLIPIFLIMLYMWKRNPKESEQRVLFVYSPAHEAHVNVITTLAKLLKSWFGMYIMLDREICLTESRDPMKWFEKSFYNATHVVFFTSPYVVAPDGSKKSVYKKLFNLALRHTQEEMSKKDSTKQFLVASFPYSNPNIIVELINFQRFQLPKDLSKFINVIQNNTFLDDSKRQPGYKKVKTGLKEALENNKILRDIFDNFHPDVIFKNGGTQYKLLPYKEETKPPTQIAIESETPVQKEPKKQPAYSYNIDEVLRENEAQPQKEKVINHTHSFFV